jgi:PD-(D/E)XK nuclease superfamily
VSEKPDSNPTIEELEGLFVNNGELAKIEGHLGRFNPIRVMKMERMEIRHSAILGWLLTPSESHGLDDKFLKAFVSEALRGFSAVGAPTALDITRADLRDANVRLEWQNIDIFVYSETNAWCFVIENKFDSKQHQGQLSKYYSRVTAGLGNAKEGLVVRGIFLTLKDEEPQDPQFAPINYEAICQILRGFLDNDGHQLTPDVRTFLRHYNEIIAEEVGMSDDSEDMKKLARQLYRDNKKALDFIVEHGATTDFMIAAEQVFGVDREYLDLVEVEGTKYRFSLLEQKQVSFLPDVWYQALGREKFSWKGCEEWWAGYPLILWLQVRAESDGISGRIELYAEVGPIEDYEFRSGLITAIQTAGEKLTKGRISFQRTATKETAKYSKFLKENRMKVKDLQNGEEIAEHMLKLMNDFQPEIKAVAAILSDFKKYGYVE